MNKKPEGKFAEMDLDQMRELAWWLNGQLGIAEQKMVIAERGYKHMVANMKNQVRLNREMRKEHYERMSAKIDDYERRVLRTYANDMREYEQFCRMERMKDDNKKLRLRVHELETGTK